MMDKDLQRQLAVLWCGLNWGGHIKVIDVLHAIERLAGGEEVVLEEWRRLKAEGGEIAVALARVGVNSAD